MTDTLPINPTPWPLAAEKVEGHWTQGANRDGDRMCLVGGLEACGLAPGEWLIARAVARHRGHGEGWNDDPARTEGEVVGWLRSAEPITPGELGEVFGPQSEHVCALVLRAARLTDNDAKSPAAAWDAARDAAWDAARAAARAAALAAARAAAAVVVRDLITPEQYALLAGPWESVMGPIEVAS